MPWGCRSLPAVAMSTAPTLALVGRRARGHHASRAHGWHLDHRRRASPPAPGSMTGHTEQDAQRLGTALMGWLAQQGRKLSMAALASARIRSSTTCSCLGSPSPRRVGLPAAWPGIGYQGAEVRRQERWQHPRRWRDAEYGRDQYQLDTDAEERVGKR